MVFIWLIIRLFQVIQIQCSNNNALKFPVLSTYVLSICNIHDNDVILYQNYEPKKQQLTIDCYIYAGYLCRTRSISNVYSIEVMFMLVVLRTSSDILSFEGQLILTTNLD